MANKQTSNQALTADNITDAQLVDLLRLGEDDEAEAALRALREPRRFFNGLGVGDEHLQAYLNEFVFRFNRRFYPFNAFRSLLGLSVAHESPTYEELYDGDWIHPGTTDGSVG